MSIEDHSAQLPQTTEEGKLVKVRFPLPAADRVHGVDTENLWAEPLSSGLFRIANTPFYVYGVSFQDIVHAENCDGRIVYGGVASRGGHSTYRILLQNAEGYEDENFKKMWTPLREIGCSYEVAKRRWLAIDVPALTDVVAAYAALEDGERAGIWTFEEGHCGHQLGPVSNQ